MGGPRYAESQWADRIFAARGAPEAKEDGAGRARREGCVSENLEAFGVTLEGVIKSPRRGSYLPTES